MNDPFLLLGVPETADDTAIKQAYLRKVKEFPPDRAPERFQSIRTAFETIQTRRARVRYRLFRTELPAPSELLQGDAPRGDGRRPTLEQLQQTLARTLTTPSN